jgi:hypothetical protein
MLQIRSATREDVPVLISLIRRLAAYENKAHQAVVTREDLLRDGFGPQPKFRALVALWDEAPAGYASFFYFYSSISIPPFADVRRFSSKTCLCSKASAERGLAGACYRRWQSLL